jgi:hypothetical protein
MASFTDNLQYLTNFTPYRQQIPLDEMKQVGMYKQAKYEEGVQKIQTNIDNIVGLDVARDIDKVYLQSKLNQLGNNLKTVAAGDFSNFQLVNSVNGMTSQIVKDPFVQAAISSTAKDKKQLSEMEADKKAGKLTPHAEYVYNLKRSAYYNNPNLRNEKGEPISFSGQYIPSWDLDKNMLEAIKAVGDSKWSVDTVFQKDPTTGGILYKNGIPIYSNVATREIRAGKFSKSIEAAIDSVLSRPEAKQELGMQGVYNYRGYNDINDFVKQYEEQKTKGIAIGEQRKLELMSAIITAKTPQEKQQYQAQIDNIDSQIIELTTTTDAKILEAHQYDNALDAYKAALQTQRTRNNYLTMGVTETNSKEYIENIPYKQQQADIKANRDWLMAQDASKRGWAGVDQARKNYELNKDKWDYVKTHPPGVPNTPDKGIPDTVEAKDNYLVQTEKAEAASSNLNSLKRKFAIDYLRAINFGNGKSAEEVTDKKLNDQLDFWIKKDPTFLDTKYGQWKKNVENNPNNKYFARLSSNIPVLNEAETNVATENQILKEIINSPEAIAANSKDIDMSIIESKLSSHEFYYTDPNSGILGFGQSKIKGVLTPRDITNLAIMNRYSRGFNTSSEKALFNNAKKAIENKYKVDAEVILAGAFPHPGTGIPRNKGIESDFANVEKIISSQKFADVYTAREAAATRIMSYNAPVVIGVYNDNSKAPERTTTNDKIKEVLGLRKGADMNVTAFSNALDQDKVSNISFVINTDNTVTLRAFDGKTKTGEIEVSMIEAKRIKPNLVIPEKISNINRLMDANSNGTSNYNNALPEDPNAYIGSYKKLDYFKKKFNRTDIMGADIVENKQTGASHIFFYVKDKTTGKVEPVVVKSSPDADPYNYPSRDAAENSLLKDFIYSTDIDNIINNSK